MRYQQTTLFDHQFLTDADDSLDLIKYGSYEIFESGLIRESLWKGAYFVDIGAHIGYYSCLACSCDARVTAYEPNPLNYAFLKANLSQYGKGGIGTSPCAVGEAEGQQKLYLSPVNSGDDSLYPFDDYDRPSIPVDVIRLDDIDFWDYPDFIKIDIQGSELKALRGMEETLNRGVAKKMAIEYFPPALRAAGDDPIDMLLILWNHGFKLWEIREELGGGGHLDPITDISFCDREDFRVGFTNLWCIRE